MRERTQTSFMIVQDIMSKQISYFPVGSHHVVQDKNHNIVK